MTEKGLTGKSLKHGCRRWGTREVKSSTLLLYHSHLPYNSRNFSYLVIFCKYLDFPKLCILSSTGSVLSCRPEVWARREAEKIVAARDAAYAEAVAKGEPIDEGEDIGDFKPSDMKRIL